jgi:hypothetical protein
MKDEVLCDNYDCPVCMQCARFNMEDATRRFIPGDDLVCEHFKPLVTGNEKSLDIAWRIN